jgi:DNA-binding protein
MAEPDNIIYIGKKPTTAYILAVATQAAQNDSIRIKARGRSISTAVDISQISVNRQLKDWKVGSVTVGTEERPYTPREGEDPKGRKAGDMQRVSFIEITIQKSKK